MWMIILTLPVFLVLLAMGLWGHWNNRQVDKYEEWIRQQDAQENSGVPV